MLPPRCLNKIAPLFLPRQRAAGRERADGKRERGMSWVPKRNGSWPTHSFFSHYQEPGQTEDRKEDNTAINSPAGSKNNPSQAWKQPDFSSLDQGEDFRGIKGLNVFHGCFPLRDKPGLRFCRQHSLYLAPHHRLNNYTPNQQPNKAPLIPYPVGFPT